MAWVAHEFGSVSAGAHRVPTTGRVPALISNSNDNSMFARLGPDYEIRNQWFFAFLEAMTTD